MPSETISIPIMLPDRAVAERTGRCPASGRTGRRPHAVLGSDQFRHCASATTFVLTGA